MKTKKTTSISVIAYKSKILSNGEHPLMLRLAKDGQRVYKSLGLSCHPSKWNFKKHIPKKVHPEYDLLIAAQDKLIKIREFTPKDHLEFPSYDKLMSRNEIESDIYQCWDQLEEKFLKALVEPVHNRLRRN